MQQQPFRKSMTSTMTTTAMVLMGALTANASILRLKGSNSVVASKESSSADTSLHEAGKAIYSSDAMAVGSSENTIDQQVYDNNNYTSNNQACDACYAHSSESNGAKTVSSVQALSKAIGRKCACLAYSKDSTYKFFCAKQKYNGDQVLDGFTASDATNIIAGLGGCKCTRSSTCTGDNCGMHKDSAEACQKWAATNGKQFDFHCSSAANPNIYPSWCAQRPQGCWRETNGNQRVFFNAGDKYAAYANTVNVFATTTGCTTMEAYTNLPRRRRTSYGTGRTPLYCPETMVGTGPKNEDYRGCQSKTRSGRTCQAWSSQTPHTHTVGCSSAGEPCTQPLPNSCRNPAGGGTTIWCYTADSSSRWEYCDARDPTAVIITR